MMDVLFRNAKRLGDPGARYPGFKTESSVLPIGYVYEDGAMPLPLEIICDRDVPVQLRDGTVIYTDIFRPPGAVDLPALIAWSPYGKRGGSSRLDDIPGRYGIAKSATSGLEKWEGPDPAYWCARGYAIVNPDARGAWSSEGDIYFWGRQEGEDGYDLIEWVAMQPWSSGKVALTGNSWLAIAQWFIAAERPPHLAAIAPWEGMTDAYHNGPFRGGIPDFSFMNKLLSEMFGPGRVEDLPAMSKLHPLYDEYWQDKSAKLEQITVPAYVAASWTNGLHVPGTFDGFVRLGSKEKWLRIHNSHEWPDYYDPTRQADLCRFFDRYLKDIDNGWESTPKVRVSVFDPSGSDIVDRAETDFPPPQTVYRRLYLSASDGALHPSNPETADVASYDTAGEQAVVFELAIDTELELTGFFKLHLSIGIDGADDGDVFALLQHVDAQGNVRKFSSFEPGFTGPHGRLRLSHRALDDSFSTDHHPRHLHRAAEPVTRGQVVEIDIGLTPIGMKLHPGEKLRLTIAGYNPAQLKFDWVVPPDISNSGGHSIYCGGAWQSYLLVPEIASPSNAGDRAI